MSSGGTKPKLPTGSPPSAVAIPTYRQVKLLIAELQPAKAKVMIPQLRSIIQMYGEQVVLFIIKAAVEESELALQVLFDEMIELKSFPNLATIFVKVIESDARIVELTHKLLEQMRLPFLQYLSITLAICESPFPLLKERGYELLKVIIPEIKSGKHKLTPEVIHQLLYVIRTNLATPPKQKQSLLQSILSVYPDVDSSSFLASMFQGLDISDVKNDSSKKEDALLSSFRKLVRPVDFLIDIGYVSMSSVARFRELLKSVSDLSVKDIANMIAFMVRTHTGYFADQAVAVQKLLPSSKAWSSSEALDKDSLSSWNIDVFIKTLNEFSISWIKVYENLDVEHFQVNDFQGMTMLVDIYHIASNGQRFPLEILFREWEHKPAQLSLLREAILSPVELIDFSLSKRVFAVPAGINIPQASIIEHEPRETTFGISNRAWYSLDVIETLLKLSDSNLFFEVQQLFKPPLDFMPEILLCILAEIGFQCTLKEQIFASLLPKYIINHPSSGVVLSTLWGIDCQVIIQWMVRLYINEDPGFLSRILDIAQDLKVQEALTAILQSRPFIFSIDLAILASRREFLNLEKWLNSKIIENGRSFVLACMEYIKDYVEFVSGRTPSAKRHCIPMLSWETIKVFFDCLQKNPALLTKELVDEMNVLSVYCRQAPKPTKADSIEKEANAYFQKIYDSSLSINEMVDVLFRFMNSKDPRENEIYLCMIHSLFDEYRFFKKYPERELQVTGVLFGTLILKNLLNEASMQLAIKYVIESLKQPSDSKLFRFGRWALEQFIPRVADFPELYSQLLESPQFRSSCPDLADYMTKLLVGRVHPPIIDFEDQQRMLVAPTLVGQQPPIVLQTPSQPAEEGLRNNDGAALQQAAERPKLQKIDSDVLMQTYDPNIWVGLDATVKEKLLFQINSVVMNNFQERAADIALLLDDSNYDHFAHYLVAKRVTGELNNHEVYLALMRKMNIHGFTKAVLKATYHGINILLSSDAVLQPGSERNLLKNLGIWLGDLTTARNRPPLARYLNLKKLLLDGFLHNRLAANVPIVCKVLLGCAKSTIFKPPNPWLMSLLAILAETYQLSELRLNTKFEIEMVFNKLQLEIEDVPVRNHFARLMAQKRSAETEVSPAQAPPVQKVTKPEESVEIAPPPVNVPSTGTPRGIILDPSLGAFAKNASFKELVEQALDNSVREIITPVLDRSPHIACITTRELIVKDFAMEPDEKKMRRAAHLMVRSLTGNLVIFTGKEPLRGNFANHLRQAFIASRLPVTGAVLEEVIQKIVKDNLEFACSIMEHFAWERATSKIDEHLSAFYAIRQTHREQSRTPFYDTSIFTSGAKYPGALPDILRPKPGLSVQQLKVYEDFAMAGHHIGDVLPLEGAIPNHAATPQAVPTRVVVNEVRSAQEKLDMVLTRLDQLVSEISRRDPSLILVDAELNSTIQSVSTTLFHMNGSQRQEVAIEFAKTVFTMLLNSTAPIQVDICLMLLKAVRMAHNELAKDLTIMICRVIEEHNYINAEALIGLMREGMVHVSQLDISLVKLISSGHPTYLDHAIVFLSRAIIIEHLVPPQEFRHSLDTLTKIMQHCPVAIAEHINLLFERIRSLVPRQPAEAAQSISVMPDDRRVITQCCLLFEEWMNLYLRQPSLPEKVLVQFVAAFEREGMFKNVQTVEDFFSTIIPVCIDSCVGRNSAQASQEVHYEYVESLAKFVIVLVKMLPPVLSVTNLSVLTSFLNVLSHQISRDFEINRQLMNQKPYYRLFVCLIQDLCCSDSTLETIEVDILMAFGRTFHTLQPAKIPEFCFSWLQLISHRKFMPFVLLTKNSRCLTFFQTLLVDLFKFLERFLRKPELTDAILHLYRGTLRVLLVLLHDFPEFLCEFHFSFCDVIPPTCIQMRNLILSAFPRNMRLPDPFLPNLRVGLLPEIKQDPKIRADITAALVFSGLNADIDAYVRNKGAHPSFFDELIERLYLPGKEAAIRGTVYNVSLINSLVLYVGVQGIKTVKQDGGTNSPMEIFHALALKLDEEGRSHFFNAIANQLRYPNNHTYYFSNVLLQLFAEASIEIVREQITKVLLERLIVHRPHPWGLLITFIELIKNPKYNLLDHEFTKCASEIESLFESVGRSCMQNSSISELEDRQELAM